MGMIESLFPASGFDQWANTYDSDILNEAQFPFDGYRRALETVIYLAEAQAGMNVLDLGAGTGNLASLFVQLGCQVWGIDFSHPMLAQAQKKLPQVPFFLGDLRQDLPPGLPDYFDRIVSAYVFHHFNLPQKIQLIEKLTTRLAPAGRIVLADISFSDQLALQHAKQMVGDSWEDEFYWIADETIPILVRAGLEVSFSKVSSMAGVFLIQQA